MSAARVDALGEGRYALSGDLTFATVPRLWRDTDTLFVQGELKEMDLQGVSRADSAGIALLIEWLRSARERGGAVRYRNVPEQIQAIARLGGLEEVLVLS